MSYGVRIVYKGGMQSGGEDGVQMGCAERGVGGCVNMGWVVLR